MKSPTKLFFVGSKLWLVPNPRGESKRGNILTLWSLINYISLHHIWSGLLIISRWKGYGYLELDSQMFISLLSVCAFLLKLPSSSALFPSPLYVDWQVGVPKILDGDMLAQFLELTSSQQEAVLSLPLGPPDTIKTNLKPFSTLPISISQVVQLLERVHYALN